MFAPANVDALKFIGREKGTGGGDRDLAARFPHVKDVTAAKASGKPFVESLLSGAFKTN
jgi:hypothetical protein